MNEISQPTASRAQGEPIRVVIADDHAVVRRGLCAPLEAEGGFDVVAQADTIDGARRYVRGHRPDVLVLDLNMPEARAFTRTR